MTISTLTLADFLRARLDEEENLARSAGHGCGYLHEHNAGWLEVNLPDEHNARPVYDMRFIEHFNPARVLAEVAAKRAILDLGWAPFFADPYASGMEQDKEDVMRLLALPYSNHPDYDEQWRP